MTEKTDLRNLTLPELEERLKPLSRERYRSRQVFRWVFGKREREIGAMTDLAKALRVELTEHYYISRLTLLREQRASCGTRKFLFGLNDGQTVESVLIPDEDRLTLCVSSQVGCPLGCRFCLTGQGGFVRDLTAAEIVGQILEVQALLPEGNLTNLVFMGMGEPLLNFDEVRRALEIIFNDLGLAMASRRVTVSTAGIIPRLSEMFEHYAAAQLAVSLNAVNNEVRDYIMPVNRKYPLPELLSALKRLKIPPRRRITFEYVMLRGVNDSLADARELTRLLAAIPAKINLIPFNEVEGLEFKTPARQTVEAFQEILMQKRFLTIIRESRGREIQAACGQLRGGLNANRG